MPARGYKKPNARTERLVVRVTPARLVAYKAAAKNSGRPLSKWVRAVLDAMAGVEETNEQ